MDVEISRSESLLQESAARESAKAPCSINTLEFSKIKYNGRLEILLN